MNVILFFTYGISLYDWKNSGILDKELTIYKKLYKDNDVNFTFITYGDESDLSILGLDEKIQVLPAYKSKKFINNKYLRFLNSLMIPFKFKKQLKKADLYKTNQLLGSWVPIIAKILYKKPLIVRTGYDLLTFSILNKKNKIKVLLYRLLTRYSLSRCDLYIVTSKVDRDFLANNFSKFKNKIKVRPNWVSNNNKEKFSNRYDKKIISVGRLEEQKNFYELIECVSGSDYEIIIYGAGSQKTMLENFAKKVGVSLEIKDPIDNASLLKELNKYRAYVTTSSFEGNPKAVLEAMSCGCVVIAKYNKNILEIIRNNHNGFIFKDKDEVVSLLNEIVKDKNKWDLFSNRSLDSVLRDNEISKILNDEWSDYLELTR